MGKKILIGITILLIAALFTGWYLFTREAKYLGTPAFSAIPENAALVMRIHHIKEYTSKSINNPIWKACSVLPGISDMYKNLRFADSLLKATNKPDNPLEDKDLTIAYQAKNDETQWLYLIEIASLSEKSALVDLTGKSFTGKAIANEKIRFGGAEIICYTSQKTNAKQIFYSTIFHGLFMESNDLTLIKQTVSKLENPNKAGSTIFEKANKSTTSNIDAQIYLNHKKLPQFSQKLFSSLFLEQLEKSAPLAEWSEIDLTQKTDELILNGFSFTSDSLNNHLALLLHQKPDSFRLAQLFPAQTSFFLGYVINDNTQFFSDYEHQLAAQHVLEDYKKSLNQVDSIYGINLQKLVTDHLDGAAAIVFTRPDTAMPQENKYLVLKVNSQSQVEEALAPISVMIPGRRKRDKPKNYAEYQIDKETIFKIYKTPVNDFGKRIFGELFGDVVTNYYTFYDNCLILGPSFDSLGRFLRANVIQETLYNDKAFRNFTSALSDRLNIYLWCSPGHSLPFFKDKINGNIFETAEKEHKTLLKIESFGWQVGNENGLLYNMARLKFNPDLQEIPSSLVWKSHLASPVITRPLLVTNHSAGSGPQILLQDGEYNLVMMSHDGRILWKIKLKSQINSDIVQLDCKKDGQLQYFFSTTEALHLVSGEGNYLPDFPVKLHSAATNGVSVADYDQNKDYRFFIACNDHKVYLYDKKGKIVTGWSPPKSEHNVITPVQFFRIENKDHLIFADKNRVYILDRKGKPIVNINENLTFSGNRFTLVPKSGKNKPKLITTDAKGSIISIGFDGTVKKLTLGNFSPGHHFLIFGNGTDNGRRYLIVDGDSLVSYDQQANKNFSRKFNHPITSPPQLFTFPDKSVKIGITDGVENKIYLLNSDGTVCNGFPIEGNSPFSLHFPSNENVPFNVITGTADGYLNWGEVR